MRAIGEEPATVAMSRPAGLALAALCVLFTSAPTAAQTFTPFVVPAPGISSPTGIATGPDGALWFGDPGSNAIWRLTTTGIFTPFMIPTSGASPAGIVAGSDGALWFTENGANKIGRITTAGAFQEFTLPNPVSLPNSITAGPDGALWFTETVGRIGRITTGGAISEFNTASSPGSITAGPDGALWFTQGNRIGRITTGGAITTVPILTLANTAVGIAAGADGALWFTEERGIGLTGLIGRITTAGAVTEFAVPAPGNTPAAITAGPDGALWFLEQDAVGNGMIGRISSTGGVTQFSVPSVPSRLGGITVGPDNELWFTENNVIVGRVFQLVPAPIGSFLTASVLPSSRSSQVGTTVTAFATVISSSPIAGTSCGVAPVTGVPGSFVYQTTNPNTNALTGSPNTPVTIFPGTSQTFLVAFTLTAPFTPVNAVLGFACANLDAALTLPGINTLLLTAASAPVPDVIALAATSGNDGIVHLLGLSRTGAFAVATANVGATGNITVSVNTGAAILPVALGVCQTNPVTGACMGPAGPSVTTTIAAGATPTFGVFAVAGAPIPSDPSVNRIFVRFTDSGGTTRGSTSVAVQTQ